MVQRPGKAQTQALSLSSPGGSAAQGNANGNLNSGNHCLAATGDSGEPSGFSLQKQVASCARDSWKKSTHSRRGRPQRWQEPQASHQDSQESALYDEGMRGLCNLVCVMWDAL